MIVLRLCLKMSLFLLFVKKRYFEIFKGLRKIYIFEVRVLHLLKPYLFFIALTIAIHHKPNKDLLILGKYFVSGE